ncbi:MAG: hypothetical protein JWM77_525 [Rhodospirillales bacterium]|nr:hypothetical protein [Rhodospirillales bacterium]
MSIRALMFRHHHRDNVEINIARGLYLHRCGTIIATVSRSTSPIGCMPIDAAQSDVPTAMIHGREDQIAPIDVGGGRSSTLIKNITHQAYAGAPHGLTDTHEDQLNNDPIVVLKS